MDPVAAKYIGAGIACIGMGGAGVGVGTIFGNYLAAALRNPSAAQGQFGNLIFGFAVTGSAGIFSLLMRCCCSRSDPFNPSGGFRAG
jgi:F-type H+-transporting ATPase subunit c